MANQISETYSSTPFKITGLTVLRTYEFIGKRFSSGYHNTTHPEFIDDGDIARAEKTKHINDITQHHYTPDRSGTDLTPTIWKPQTVNYPYERLEEIEPYYSFQVTSMEELESFGKPTVCKMCVNICPNSCLHMTTELRVDVLDSAEGEWEGYGAELEVGKFAAVEKPEVTATMDSFNLATAHTDAPDEWRFGEVLDLSGDSARMRWNDTGEVDHVPVESLYPADDQIVSGRIDLGRCMFCGLCMEACNFTSFFMTNEYDGMSGFTRQDLWMDAGRTRVLIGDHQEAVDAELAKRASKERDKRAKKAAKAAGEA